MSGPRYADDAPCTHAFIGGFFNGHDLGPRAPVAVVDDETDRTAERFAETDAGKDADFVGLDVLTVSASVAQLAALGLRMQIGALERDPRGDAFDDAEQGLAVRFTRRQITQAHAASFSRR